jgi:trehalose 6-phosphate synthase/phosphatase
MGAVNTLINVSNRLPVSLLNGEIKESSGGLVSALSGVGGEHYQLQWIGWPGKATDNPEERKQLEQRLRDEFKCIPVFLTDPEVHGYYQGFSNSSLWPLLHYMPTRFHYQRDWWDQYVAVNRRFADAVLSIAKESDLVWVHDYHLMLLPAMLKAEMPGLKIGFFLHTPFPAPELFSMQPQRRELLEGMLGADQIGFHTFGYLRHFRSTVLRLLGVESEVTRVRSEGHVAHLGVYPIGINSRRFEEALNSDEYRKELAELQQTHEGKRIVFAVERLDYTKGILHRLQAIDLFLEQSPERENVRFVFVSVPSREEVDEYKDLREDVESRVGRINGKHSTLHNTPIHFVHGSVEFHRLCAMYSLAEVALVTPLIDGMNLVAKEYVACQKDTAGVLILSEFAGAAEELSSAIVVNPHDAQGVADALKMALEMPSDERFERMAAMRGRVMRCDAAWWARTFIDDLESRPATASQAASDPSILAGVGQRIGEAFGREQRVAFFLDYDGTLREIEWEPEMAAPTHAVRQVLDRLANCPNLDVTLVSGRRSRELERWFGSYPFGLVAEHGAEIRRPRQTQWDRLDRHIRYEWKNDVVRVLKLYEDLTPGSFIEQKHTGFVWHYRKSDPEFGDWKARQLVEELSTILANEPVIIRHGKKIVEVVNTVVTKGTAVARLIEDTQPQVALCVGDDQTDETMLELRLPILTTIKVGAGETKAQLRVASPAQFRRLLMSWIPAPAPVEAK